ncbi:MAG: hypothetical protein ACTSWY_07150, partial [Promethearchaeota archaeon]
MQEKLYSIRIATYDQKLGPFDLTAVKGEYCKFAEKICNGFNCSFIIDAINSREKNMSFEKGFGFFQTIKLSIKSPLKRGEIERFA